MLSGKTVDIKEQLNIKPGDGVEIHSLQNHEDLNGTHGTAVSYDAEKNRWVIDLGEENVLVKPEKVRSETSPIALASRIYKMLDVTHSSTAAREEIATAFRDHPLVLIKSDWYSAQLGLTPS